MKTSKLLIMILPFVMIGSLLLSLIFEFVISSGHHNDFFISLFLGIFSSTLLVFINSILIYIIEKKNGFLRVHECLIDLRCNLQFYTYRINNLDKSLNSSINNASKQQYGEAMNCLIEPVNKIISATEKISLIVSKSKTKKLIENIRDDSARIQAYAYIVQTLCLGFDLDDENFSIIKMKLTSLANFINSGKGIPYFKQVDIYDEQIRNMLNFKSYNFD